MVEVFKSVVNITEDDIQVGDVVSVDFCDSLYTVYEVEDDQVRTDGLDGSYWIDIAYVTSVEKRAKDWIRELAEKHTFEVIPELYERNIAEYGTVNGYSYASAFDALNIAHANGINITAGLENGTLRLITANERFALINLKKDDKKMTTLHVELTEEQIEELIQNVETMNYVEYIHMIDWNDYMAGTPATEIIDSIDMLQFDTSDEYAVLDGHGRWVSSDSLEDIFSPFLDEMLQEYLDNNL